MHAAGSVRCSAATGTCRIPRLARGHPRGWNPLRLHMQGAGLAVLVRPARPVRYLIPEREGRPAESALLTAPNIAFRGDTMRTETLWADSRACWEQSNRST